jgi:hypothetical protein
MMFTITPDILRKKTNRELSALFETASRAAFDPKATHALRASAEALRSAILREAAQRNRLQPKL